MLCSRILGNPRIKEGKKVFVAQIEEDTVVNVLVIDEDDLAAFQAATGAALVPIPEGGDVIVGDLYANELFSRPGVEESTQSGHPDGILGWRKPAGLHSVYSAGALVRYEGKVWRSLVNLNVQPPGAVPGQWEEIEEGGDLNA